MHAHRSLPAFRGGALALLAASLFGASTPLVQLAGRGVGPLATACLLYVGAGLMGLALRQPVTREAALRRRDTGRLVAMASFGAVIAPVALAWGLQHTSGTAASLMLTLEALFTVVLARLLYGETMDLRVRIAVALLLAGGATLVLDRGITGHVDAAGLLAILAATAAWGIDNTLSRTLADRDPGRVVLAKAALGGCATFVIAVCAGDALPSIARAAALLALGAIGYGLSLRLYLLAQRAFGAARTGSVFAFAPFVGAAAAIVLGDRSLTWGLAAGALLMLVGVVLHLLESHGHEHAHDALEHEHAHAHDDAHHDHVHDDPQVGTHSHRHRHASLRHTHAHAPDLHHAHKH